MNLILRLIRVMIHAFFRSKLDVHGESVVKFCVLPHDLDINLHMTNSRYLAVMDLGRTDLIIRTGLAKVVIENRWAPVLGSTVIRWRKSLELFQSYEVHTKLAAWDDKWFYLDQKIIRNKRVVAHALQKAIFVGSSGSLSAAEIIQRYESKTYTKVQNTDVSKALKEWQVAEETMRKDIADYESTMSQ